MVNLIQCHKVKHCYILKCVTCFVLQVSAWGGYVFIINLIPLHVFVLLLMQRYSRRLYIGESPVPCVCLCERFCFYEVHTHTHIPAHTITPHSACSPIQWWSVNQLDFCIRFFLFGHTKFCAAAVARCTTSHESLFTLTAAFSWHWCLMTHFFPPTSLLPFTSNPISSTDLRIHGSSCHGKKPLNPYPQS